MDDLDATTVAVLEAAKIDEGVLKTLSRDDLKDLFPGPENFLRRKKLWDVIGPKCENLSDQDTSPVACSGSGIIPSVSAVLPNQPQTSTPIHETSAKTTKPHYVVYADSELDMVRSQYFEMLCSGKDINCEMPKELICRLIKNTVTNMVVMQCASPLGKEVSYPSKCELRAMSKKIIAYYPMLCDTSDVPYLTIYSKLYKQLQKMKSPRKRKRPMPQGGVSKRSLFKTSTKEETDDDDDDAAAADDADADDDASSTPVSSTASTVILPKDDDIDSDDLSPALL
ncbi:hypothetical protein Q7C36_014663 [Tachysurus vachellii]|uniref:Uncharacterized protein n=1 Tax=Tachysurus vachellii TaxID=175792 RepID=A0AA88MIH0_TACVA|nr:hypothetical protein Q7C36_014663 [Tachysurus vachellii]